MMPGLYVFAAVGIVAGALGFAGGWQVQGWRLGEQIAALKSQQAEAVATATREARAQEAARFTNVQEAQNAAQKRAQTARADADNARSELDRLRDDLTAVAVSAGGFACITAAERATTVSDVLAECAAAYTGMARTADGHANDVKTLTDAWPK